MKYDFKKLGAKTEKEAFEALKGFVSINSIYDEKTKTQENPFGLGVRRGLDYIAELGKKMGFNVDFCDHYATELSFGEGPLIDIYAHADVVPVSKNWTTDPFYPTVKDGKLICRGSADDKGPGIAALYGAKIIKDLGEIKGYKLRIIFGGNEERGSLCLEHYFHEMHKAYPTYGFSPDADYPLIYAEKGIYTYQALYKIDDERIAPFAFGDATNIVLAEAYLPFKDDGKVIEALKSYQAKHNGIKAEFAGGQLHFVGKASHGSLPWNGVNAGLHLLNFLGEYYDIPLLSRIFSDYEKGDGVPFKGDYSSETFDGSSYNIGVMSYDGKTLKVLVNMRLPENITAERAVLNVKAETPASEVTLLGGSAGLMFPLDSSLVKTLMEAYQEETGDLLSKPQAIGGGTYARDSKNSVAFGMQFPGVDSKMHEDGEFMRIEDFNKSIAIYAHAIYGLGLLARKGK
jgi:succinyl-diaminopimelate desuccinylase